jgi:hypothetical protein
VTRPTVILRRAVPAVAVGLAAVVLTSGCGQSSSVAPSQMTMPVLWAGANPDGTPAAGIEPATIAVGTDGDPGFTLNLEDVKAKKAGPAWQAATASAAAVGTLLTGADQSVVDLRYDITGAIDGPSGGAALTVGTMAAITGAPIRPRIAMTGTIAPDGTVGKVSQVPAKVRAAKKAGYRTVLVPFGNRTEFDPQAGRTVNLAALGRSLGIDVRVVRDVGQAYQAFTGRTIARPPRGTPALTPTARAVAERTTRQAVAAMRREYQAGDNLIAAALRPGIEATIAKATSALASRNTARAYGLAVRGTYQVKRATSAGASRALAAASGVAAARAALRDEVKTLIGVADRRIRAQADPAGLTTAQQLALPSALGWYTQSRAVLVGLRDQLGPGNTWRGPDLALAASVVGEVEAALQRFGPDAVAMVRSGTGTASSNTDPTAAFLSGYTDFLVSAGNANRDYYLTVEYGSLDSRGGPTDVVPGLRAMSEVASTTPPGTNPLYEEIIQAANATAYYVLGAQVVSGRSFGMQGFGLGEDPAPITAPALLANSVVQASETVRWFAADLRPDGINPDYPLWQRQWADAIFATYAGTDTAPAAGTIALNELWYAASSVLLANSARINLEGASNG